MTALPLAVSWYVTGLILGRYRQEWFRSFTIGVSYYETGLILYFLSISLFTFPFSFLSLFITFLSILWVPIKTVVWRPANIFFIPNTTRSALSWLVTVPRLPRIIGTILVETPCTLQISLASGSYHSIFSSSFNNTFLSQGT